MIKGNIPRVLLVEDEEDTITLYKSALERGGYSVTCARTADEGLADAKKEPPDLILLDIMLPGKNGFDFLKTMREDADLQSIPVLAVTNLAEEVGFDRAIEAGAAGYIIKAERTPQQVVLLVKQVLAEKHPPR